VAKESPVLGRYLFVEIPDENFYAVRGVDGVEALLTGHDGAPAEVPERKVWEFRERYMRGEWDFVAQSTIPVGARIRIMEGEFANELGVVRSRAKGRLVVLPQGERRLVQTWAENVRAA
jgi:transcription antitermination factor NusG